MADHVGCEIAENARQYYLLPWFLVRCHKLPVGFKKTEAHSMRNQIPTRRSLSATAPSQGCRPEFRKKICEQLLPATECNRVTPDNSARNRHACQNQDSSAA